VYLHLSIPSVEGVGESIATTGTAIQGIFSTWWSAAEGHN